MAILVESKLRATRPLRAYGPHHFCRILLTERITSVNEEESPILLLVVLHPQEMNCVNSPLYSHLHSPYSLSVPQSSFDSFPSTLSTQLSFILHQVSLNPTGRTPGCLSKLNKRSYMSLWYASHGVCSFSNHSVNFATIFRSSPLAPPKQGNQCCRLIELVPPNPVFVLTSLINL